jgi:hypothetical protein
MQAVAGSPFFVPNAGIRGRRRQNIEYRRQESGVLPRSWRSAVGIVSNVGPRLARIAALMRAPTSTNTNTSTHIYGRRKTVDGRPRDALHHA